MTIEHISSGPNTIAGPAESILKCDNTTREIFPNSFARLRDFVITVYNKGTCDVKIQVCDAGTPATAAAAGVGVYVPPAPSLTPTMNS